MIEEILLTTRSSWPKSMDHRTVTRWLKKFRLQQCQVGLNQAIKSNAQSNTRRVSGEFRHHITVWFFIFATLSISIRNRRILLHVLPKYCKTCDSPKYLWPLTRSGENYWYYSLNRVFFLILLKNHRLLFHVSWWHHAWVDRGPKFFSKTLFLKVTV